MAARRHPRTRTSSPATSSPRPASRSRCSCINDLPTASVTSEIRPSQHGRRGRPARQRRPGRGPVQRLRRLRQPRQPLHRRVPPRPQPERQQPADHRRPAHPARLHHQRQHEVRAARLHDPGRAWGTRIGASVTNFEYELGKDFETSGERRWPGEERLRLAPVPTARATPTSSSSSPTRTSGCTTGSIRLGTVEERFIDSVKARRGRRLPRRLAGRRPQRLLADLHAGRPEASPDLGRAQDQAPTGLKTGGTFRKWNNDFKRLQPRHRQLQRAARLRGQQATKNLASAEKMSLGGPNGVRAYPVGEATGDSGHLDHRRAALHHAGLQGLEGDVTPRVLRLGAGQHQREAAPDIDTQNKRSISGYGFGLSLGREGDFLLRAHASWSADDEHAAGGYRGPRSARVGAGGEVVLRL